MCHLHFSQPPSHALSKAPRTGFMYLHRRPGGRMQSGDRDPAQAGRHALGPLWCQHHHRSALFQTQWTIRGFLGTSLTEGRGRCLTSPHKSELHPLGSLTKVSLSTKAKPPEGTPQGPVNRGFAAVYFGANSVASALNLPRHRDVPKNHPHSKPHPSNPTSKPDISTWQRLGHFYLALTTRLVNNGPRGRFYTSSLARVRLEDLLEKD